MGIYIETVDRDEDKVVRRVVAVIDNYLRVGIILRKGRLEIISRESTDRHLYDNDELQIPPGIYDKLSKQVWAIFQSSKLKKGEGK